jgi:hypothetical protein
VLERRPPRHVVHHHRAQRAAVVGARHRPVPAPHTRTIMSAKHLFYVYQSAQIYHVKKCLNLVGT